VLLLFGTKRLPHAMSDIARGMKQFRTGLRAYPSRAACSQAMMPQANWSIAS
jgi:TatA/E family protein of Tat protein translocase